MKCFEKPTVRLELLQQTAMSDFKRSPSKVWWASESLEWREISGSPGSQDSGFSDTETSPPIPKNVIAKNSDCNLSSNYQEKTTIKQSPLYTKNVNRNLFKDVKDVVNHQYSKEVACLSPRKVRSFSEELPGRSYGLLNRSAPAVLEEIKDEEESLSNSLSSDCESELECLFNGALESPKHTSTPKMRQARNKVPLNLYLKYQQRWREPLDNNDAVQTWMTEIKHHYEQECMTTLQSKSIAGEMHQKVANMATYTISSIRAVLTHSECIQREYKSLNSEKKHVGPLAQSLAGNIIDFIKTYSEVTPKLLKQYDSVRKTNEDFLTLVSQLFTQWESVCHTVMVKEIKRLIDKLENPSSELDLRSTITGITSLCLRNDHLIEIFAKNDIIPILLILCEKCEGSSMRSLLLRALSTMCSTAFAVRQFERFSGIQIVSDTLEEEPFRPEPERSEAVALLAQVTAPWIEDNHCIKGLQDYSRKLVKSLTGFLSTTKCCQNLLLCTAALANLSTMDHKCIKHILHLNTIELLLEAVNRRGPCTSVYLLEQMATLLANMTSLQPARLQLVKLKTIPALLCCLRTGSVGEEVEKRLQQKAIIALSRLCGEKEAAAQVVQLGGVAKLVRMCREKNERFSNDAVLVATLATLRKIADACGREVISVEDVQELVEPKLLDSFLAYSSQNESYV